jgi:hypothetical protein
MWASIGPSVFLADTGEVHVCCQGCDRKSVRVGGLDVCPISGIVQGANASSMDDDEEDDGLSAYVLEEFAPIVKSGRHIDPLNLDGVLVVRNASKKVFSCLFAKRICKPDATLRAIIATRFPGRDPEPILKTIKASMLCSSDIDDITECVPAPRD